MSGVRQYVVVVRSPEEHVRAFGAYRNRARADELERAVNTEVEKRETADFEAWHALPYEDKGMAPDGYGRAGVLVIHPPDVERAIAFAAGRLDS